MAKVKIHSKEIPVKTIGRLSQYRRALLICTLKGKTHIFSHEIAAIQHVTAVQVRRDLMLIGFNGSLKQGYNIRNLIDVISEILDYEEGVNVAIFGLGNFGRALFNYFYGKRSQLRIVATFDSNTEKIGTEYNKVYCYSPYRVEEIVKKKNIKIAILTVPPKRALEVAKKLVDAGIKGILNYTSTPIDVPDDVFLDEYDMITTMEKAAFFVKMNELKL
ncbi:MAG: redox-sensing transcriptional repressor Rex [Bacteroidetes bacterium]|nr:MAG: redox-sensing transcriptional repressor Rex [Bacteroidota bacterium]